MPLLHEYSNLIVQQMAYCELRSINSEAYLMLLSFVYLPK